jgi:hypothetical protein
MVKRSKAWSMPQSDWDWLEKQDNQAAVLRQAIAAIKSRKPE